ncbi:hypothetical protein FQZ97_1061230 [compost metagenome]
MTGEIFDQNTKETFHRSADRAMDHDRLGLFRVAVDVECAETFRQVEVDLCRSALPFATDRVLQRVFELRTVEGTFARQNAGLDVI